MSDIVKLCPEHGPIFDRQKVSVSKKTGRLQCRQCNQNIYSKDHYLRNRKQRIQEQRAYQARNPERVRNVAKKWKEANHQKYMSCIIASNKQRLQELPDNYLKSRLKIKGFLEKDITQELIDIYRTSIKIRRLVKERKSTT